MSKIFSNTKRDFCDFINRSQKVQKLFMSKMDATRKGQFFDKVFIRSDGQGHVGVYAVTGITILHYAAPLDLIQYFKANEMLDKVFKIKQSTKKECILEESESPATSLTYTLWDERTAKMTSLVDDVFVEDTAKSFSVAAAKITCELKKGFCFAYPVLHHLEKGSYRVMEDSACLLFCPTGDQRTTLLIATIDYTKME